MLDQFHMRCLRRIADVKWQDKIPNTEVLDICKISSIEAFLLTAQLRWSGHVSRMGTTHLPKIVFYGQLAQGTQSLGRQYKRYKDVLKTTLTACGITPTEFESHTADRTSWRHCVRKVFKTSNSEEFSAYRRSAAVESSETLQPPTNSDVTYVVVTASPELGYTRTNDDILDPGDPSCQRLNPTEIWPCS